jgi:hypothetical protein
MGVRQESERANRGDIESTSMDGLFVNIVFGLEGETQSAYAM